MIATNIEEIEALRESGKILAEVVRETAALVRPGISTAQLDLFAEKKIREKGAVPAFLNYQPEGATYPYPAALCVSVNEEIVHGIPSEQRILTEGDIVTVDLGLSYKGYFTDHAITVPVGAIDADSKRLINATREALAAAIATVRAGGRTGDIGAAVMAIAKKYYVSVVRDLGGHGVGRAVHERPFIENFGKAGTGDKLVSGMVLAIEPMLSLGKGDISLEDDGYTYRTRDNSRAAHFEHTIVVTDSGAEILTG